ncbi:hypothetical protein JCM8208_006504 [Rhodotorula glutinis]
MTKRGRDPLDDPKAGPSKNALRGLSYIDQKPSFLRNIGAALSGQAPSSRPAVPTRPDGSEDEEGYSGDELDGATVVVLKEGKHIDQDEVDRLRAHAKATDALDPFAAGAAEPERAKSTGSLSFSTGAKGAKGKSASGAGQGDWADVIKRSKEDEGEAAGAGEGAGAAPAGGSKATATATAAKTAEDKAREAEKELKRKKKEKKKAKEKIGKLSFGEDE